MWNSFIPITKILLEQGRVIFVGSETVWVDILTSESLLLSTRERWCWKQRKWKCEPLLKIRKCCLWTPTKMKTCLYKINHMKELQSMANKFVRNVEEEMVEPANVIFGDNMITPSLPRLYKKPAKPLFDRQPEKCRRTFPSAVEVSSDTGSWYLRSQVQLYLLFWLHSSNVCQTLAQSNLSLPPVKPDFLKMQLESLSVTQALSGAIIILHLNIRSLKNLKVCQCASFRRKSRVYWTSLLVYSREKLWFRHNCSTWFYLEYSPLNFAPIRCANVGMLAANPGTQILFANTEFITIFWQKHFLRETIQKPTFFQKNWPPDKIYPIDK